MLVELDSCLAVWTVGGVVAKSRSSLEVMCTDVMEVVNTGTATVGTCSWMEVRDTGMEVVMNYTDGPVEEREVLNIQQMSSLIQTPLLGWLGKPPPCWTLSKRLLQTNLTPLAHCSQILLVLHGVQPYTSQPHRRC